MPVLSSSRILEDQLQVLVLVLRTQVHKSLDHKSLKIVKDFAFCKQSVMYDHVANKFRYRDCT